jgi:hypothetical protein
MIPSGLIDRLAKPAVDQRTEALARQVAAALPEATITSDTGRIHVQAPGLIADEFGTRSRSGRGHLRSTLDLIRKDS